MHDANHLTWETVGMRFAGTEVLTGVTLSAFGGEVLALVGPNGSGKSTLLAIAAGILKPSRGSVVLNGQSPQSDPQAYAGRIGFVSQDVVLYSDLSVLDNLRLFAALYGLTRAAARRRITAILDHLHLTDRSTDRVSSLSGGMQRRVHIAAAVLHDPTVLLLDEPTAALDDDSRRVIGELIRGYRSKHKVVVMATHESDEVEDWADRVARMNAGSVVSVRGVGDIRPSTRPCISGRFERELREQTEIAVRRRLPSTIELRVDGRRFVLIGPEATDLIDCLSILDAEGATPETFRMTRTAADSMAKHPDSADNVLQRDAA